MTESQYSDLVWCLMMLSVVQGCYIGQETLSKLTNLDALKQQLWGLDLSAPASVGDEISGMIPQVLSQTE